MASSGLEDQLLLMETAVDLAPSNEDASLNLCLNLIKLHFLSLSLQVIITAACDFTWLSSFLEPNRCHRSLKGH